MNTEFKEGDRVWTTDFDGSRIGGVIRKNIEHPEVSEWYIEFSDGDFAVLDIEQVFKIENE